jgi:hypothetical protein
LLWGKPSLSSRTTGDLIVVGLLVADAGWEAAVERSEDVVADVPVILSVCTVEIVLSVDQF